METGTPSIAKVATMVLFALSCVGLLLFLWLSFGGTLPLAAQGYRFKAAFPDASQLANEADVRIAGVNVGKVIDKELDPQGNRTLVTIQLDNKFAPIHKDAQAILRTKTILGETYVQLTPGTPRSPMLPDGATLARSNVVPAVQLDTIFNALDPTTRHAFQVWQKQLSLAVQGNDQNLSNVLGNLPPFAADATDLLQVLDVQHTAVVNLLRNGGTVFDALDRSQSALRNLITSGETTFATTAANNNAIADTFHVFPTFLNETKATMIRLQNFATDTDPADQGARAGGPEPDPDPARPRQPGAVAALVLRKPRAADHRLQDRAARDQQGARRGPAPAGIARPVPGAAQPDPRLAVPASAADRRLPRQPPVGHRGQDDERSPATASGTTCASSSRSVPRRCRWPPTATRRTAATPIRSRCGWPIRSRSRPAANTRAASRCSPGTAATPALPATGPGPPVPASRRQPSWPTQPAGCSRRWAS